MPINTQHLWGLLSARYYLKHLYHLSVDIQTLYCPYFLQLIGHFLRIMSLVAYTAQTEHLFLLIPALLLSEPIVEYIP